jgi:hypothetical protein
MLMKGTGYQQKNRERKLARPDESNSSSGSVPDFFYLLNAKIIPYFILLKNEE